MRRKEEKTHSDPEPAGEYWAGGEAGTTSAVPMRASRVLTSRARVGLLRHGAKLRGLMGDSEWDMPCVATVGRSAPYVRY